MSLSISHPVSGQQCTFDECHAPAIGRCAYADRYRATCKTVLCPEHAVIVDGDCYCRRHASTVEAMRDVAPSERDLPEVDNRAASLCEWMSAHCEAYVTELLQSVAARRPGSTVTREGLHLVLSGVPRVHAWEHNWRVVDHTGPHYTVAVRVEEPRDDTVVMKVNGMTIAEAVPPWIGNPVETEAEDDARRAAFDREILTAVYEKIRALLSVGAPGQP